MAVVFRARERALDRDVAVKVLPAAFTFDAEFVERFQREARTSAQLEHPNIIPIYRVGRAGRVIYFVMKYLRGGSLLPVDHKTVLVLLAFALILAVLALHRLTGLRGRSAARWVLGASLALILAYPGVKFVTEVLLGR